MNRFLSPLRYPGGKTAIYPFLSSLLNENNLLGCSYAEPYAGGGGVALKLLKNNLVKDIYLNDYDKAIYSLWYSILNYSDELIKWIQDIVINVETWEICRDIYKNEKDDILELGKATIFLN
ncbi:MAG: DNA adenine methylase, partial [Clostridium perfringens]|nr:DNA adenine methylase [Clostridium perfringens]